MMSFRPIKRAAKEQFKDNYWASVIVCLLATILSNGVTLVASYRMTNQYLDERMFTEPVVTEFSFPSFLLMIFVGNILTVSVAHFMLLNGRQEDNPEIAELFYAFKSNYTNVLFIMLVRYICIFLWSLLFIIPGIIKSMEYAMIPYILAENPNISRQEAFEQTKKLMDGHKLELFCLTISFIWWIILSVLTAGLVGYFWTSPYMEQTYANYYLALKENLAKKENRAAAEFIAESLAGVTSEKE